MEKTVIIATKEEQDLLNEFAGYYVGKNIDWNRLMPVVEKIDHLYSEAFPSGEEFVKKILAHESPIDSAYIDVIALPLATKIDEAYKAVVEFIKWYNEQKKKP